MNISVTKKVTSIRLSEELLNLLKEKATAANRSLSNYIEYLLKQSVEEENVWAVIEESEKQIKEGNCTTVTSKEEQDAFLDSL